MMLLLNTHSSTRIILECVQEDVISYNKTAKSRSYHFIRLPPYPLPYRRKYQKGIKKASKRHKIDSPF